jgi:hypothetical protein
LLAWLIMIGPGLGLILGGGLSAWGRWNVLRKWPAVSAEVIAADVEVKADAGVGETSGEPAYLARNGCGRGRAGGRRAISRTPSNM